MAGTPLVLPGGGLLPAIAVGGHGLLLVTLSRQEWLAIGGAALLIVVLRGLRLWRERRLTPRGSRALDDRPPDAGRRPGAPANRSRIAADRALL